MKPLVLFPRELLHQMFREFCRHCQEGTEPGRFLLDEVDLGDDADTEMVDGSGGAADDTKAIERSQEQNKRDKEELRAILEAKDTLLGLCLTLSAFRGWPSPIYTIALK
ncbi:hypothetical protein PG996_015590 [Apiospora saccharicola]|uniref:Uncharacterized protein n=1 Tax=Apiospora saccharicola TaxID=335842 RepID=A0ABR1TNT1_9PEZI